MEEMMKRARRADLTEGTRIVATVWGVEVPGTVEYLERDYDGRSWKWMAMFKPDDVDRGSVMGAWLNEIKVA